MKDKLVILGMIWIITGMLLGATLGVIMGYDRGYNVAVQNSTPSKDGYTLNGIRDEGWRRLATPDGAIYAQGYYRCRVASKPLPKVGEK